MRTTTPTPENAPQAGIEAPRAEFDEPLTTAPENGHTVGVSLPNDQHTRRVRPWAYVALALPVALALLALLAAAHAPRRHHSAPTPHQTQTLQHRARHTARRPNKPRSAPTAHRSVAEPAPAVPAPTTEAVPVAPAADANKPAQSSTSNPSGGEEQSGGGPFSP
jgi:hypothetical protein